MCGCPKKTKVSIEFDWNTKISSFHWVCVLKIRDSVWLFPLCRSRIKSDWKIRSETKKQLWCLKIPRQNLMKLISESGVSCCSSCCWVGISNLEIACKKFCLYTVFSEFLKFALAIFAMSWFAGADGFNFILLTLHAKENFPLHVWNVQNGLKELFCNVHDTAGHDIFVNCWTQLVLQMQMFLVLAQFIIMFGVDMSATARHRRIVNALCYICRNSFPNSWEFEQQIEQHLTCYKLYSQATRKVEILATRRSASKAHRKCSLKRLQ